MKKFLPHIVSVIVMTFVIAGCSELKNESVPTKTEVTVHGKGFADTTNVTLASFHGKYIQSKNYDLSLCQQCHGLDYSGGKVNQSCLSCHNKTGGPENCTTCHGSVNPAPPKDLSDNTSPAIRGVGAHQKHLLGGLLGAPVACRECHVVPSKVSDAGHIDNTLHAEITFNTSSKFYRANAVYNADSVSCSNTYCHGNFGYGNNAIVQWTNNTGTATMCGTCHSVANTDLVAKGHPVIGTKSCSDCHGHVVDSGKNIINPALHINGQVDF